MTRYQTCARYFPRQETTSDNCAASSKQQVALVPSNLSIMELGQIVRDFASAMETVDHRRPQATSSGKVKRQYKPGIGPFGEDDAVAMTVAQMRAANSAAYPSVGKTSLSFRPPDMRSRARRATGLGHRSEMRPRRPGQRYLRSRGLQEDPLALRG